MNLSAFVLMPFSQRFNQRYEVIRDSASQTGIRAERVDQQFFLHQGITHKIMQQIVEADILIADLSKQNPNVYYEVGYAHANSRPCILLTTDATRIPFDLKDRRHVVFSGLRDLRMKLVKEFEALKAELELGFDGNDVECFGKVAVQKIVTSITGSTLATSIRVKSDHPERSSSKKCNWQDRQT